MVYRPDPLPEPCAQSRWFGLLKKRYFTEQEMRTYAAQEVDRAVEAERQRCVSACREVERQPIRRGANAEFDMGKSVGAEKCIQAILHRQVKSK